jgi:hypothetical protein
LSDLLLEDKSIERINATFFWKPSFLISSCLISYWWYYFGSANPSLCQEFAKLMQPEFEISLMKELEFLLENHIKQHSEATYTHQKREAEVSQHQCVALRWSGRSINLNIITQTRVTFLLLYKAIANSLSKNLFCTLKSNTSKLNINSLEATFRMCLILSWRNECLKICNESELLNNDNSSLRSYLDQKMFDQKWS